MKPSSSLPNHMLTVLAVVFWATTPIPIRAAEFIVLDEERTNVAAVSGDGSTVVGSYYPGTNQPRAMVWTPENGIVGLPGDIRGGNDVNYDGSIIVGGSQSDLVIWKNGVLQPPISLPGDLEHARHQRINSDGSVITLRARPDATGETEILRWTNGGGFTSLTGPSVNGTPNRPGAISADGGVIVGRADGVGAMRWTEATGIVALGGTEAEGVSGDGSVVAGYWRPGTNDAPFRWTADSGLVGLDNLPGFPRGKATDVSADGSFLMGYSIFDASAPEPILQDAWLWTEQTGTRRLVDILVNDHNIDMGDIGEYTRFRMRDISDDGRVLVGTLINTSASYDIGWVAILDHPLFALPPADFNDDGLIDCMDVDSLVMEIVAGSHDPAFDLTSDGFVDTADLDEWRVQGGAAILPSGNPYLEGDATLDGTVDGLDYIRWNNHKFTSVAAWCSGDFNADGLVDGLDFVLWNENKFMSAGGVNAVPEPRTGVLFMLGLIFAGAVRRYSSDRLNFQTSAVAPSSCTCLGVRAMKRSLGLVTSLGLLQVAIAPDCCAQPIVWADNGHAYEFILADGIDWPVARDAATNLEFQGIAGHVATVTSQEENDFIAQLVEMAKTVHGLAELREVWLGAEQLDPNAPPESTWAWVTGEPIQFTNWELGEPNDAGSDEHYLGMWGTDGSGPLGEWNDQGEPWIVSNIEGYVVEFPAPPTDADFNNDGLIDCLDADSLVMEIVARAHDPTFDMTGDGFVNLADLDEWRTQGGAANLPSGSPYLEGDATLDGTVDGLDYIRWNNHKFTSVAAWCSGDFNADGLVDGLDFVLWNENKFMSAGGVIAVPEPGTTVWSVLALILVAVPRVRR